MYTRTTVAGLIWSEIQQNADLEETWEQRIWGWGLFPYVKQHLVNEGVKKIEIGKGSSGLSAKWVVHKKTVIPSDFEEKASLEIGECLGSKSSQCSTSVSRSLSSSPVS